MSFEEREMWFAALCHRRVRRLSPQKRKSYTQALLHIARILVKGILRWDLQVRLECCFVFMYIVILKTCNPPTSASRGARIISLHLYYLISSLVKKENEAKNLV